MPEHWNDNAEIRRQQIEGGRDLTFSKVFVPYYSDLISRLRPASIIEVGGGTGHLALALNSLTRRYVMLEPSPGMHKVAHAILACTNVEIHNCTAETFYGYGPFDLVLSHICVQAVPNLASFLAAVARQVSAKGNYVISLPHPAFYNDYKKFFTPEEFCYMKEQSRKVSFSITLDPQRSINGIPYYHRPISKYVSDLASAGLCLTSLEEVYPPSDVQELYGHPWENPRYLVMGGCRR